MGTMDEHASAEDLLKVVMEFCQEFEERFGSHIHILDWALHMDEGTPHIQERHVFDAKNQYGELCPQQEKALEELGIPFPIRISQKGNTITGNRLLMRSAGNCCLRLPKNMVCILNGNLLMAVGRIWKSRIIS